MNRTLYVSPVGVGISEGEVKKLFDKYGRIAHIVLEFPSRPYAYVEFEYVCDAEDARRGRDGCIFHKNSLQVELAHLVTVSGLPSTATWKELRNHMGQAGHVRFSHVFREGGATFGIIDYRNYADMKHAITTLDKSEIKTQFARGVIQVKVYDSSSSPGHTRGTSYSRNGSRRRKSYLGNALLNLDGIWFKCIQYMVIVEQEP